ncbi:MAG: AMP-binding protein, partial [Thermoleophilaceae bacterium]|nr:AMP-binding protein [Thermoleophilaceae bacterium]
MSGENQQFESFWQRVEWLAADPPGLALVELARDGSRHEFGFSDVVLRSGAFSGALARAGVGRGDVVLTLAGNRPEWVFAMLACWRIGAVVLPCNEMLRAKDIAHRVDQAGPRVVVCDERNLAQLQESGWRGETLVVPDNKLFHGEPAPAAELSPADPALMIFTSGTSGTAKAVVHTHGCLPGQQLQAEHWFGARPGELAWCTAASGWSKSARNVFLTPWLCGATALLHDERFDPAQRMEIVEREQVNVLCMAPTEYRVIARRHALKPIATLRQCVSAGEALNAEILNNWRDGVGVEIRDGYGQTETGAVTAVRPGGEVKPGSMGPPLPGVVVRIVDGELEVDPTTVPTFFSGYGRPGATEAPQLVDGWWRTGDLVSQDGDGYLWFESRNDDIILSAGYRIGPFEVESALVSHEAVADAAAVAEPDDERGSVVRAVIVLKDGYTGDEQLVSDLQAHVKAVTAPYKYPRIVEFVEALPKTASGKVRRALL